MLAEPRRSEVRRDDDRVAQLTDEYLARRIDRRQFFQRATALGLSAGAAGSLLAACGGDEDEAAPKPRKEVLTIRLRHDIQNLDPAFWPADIDEMTMACICEGLVSYKPGTWDVVNSLAESLESSPDGLRHAFTLKEGIPFHGGYGEVTAEDVKFSYERIAGLTKPKLESPYVGDWASLEQVRVTGTHTGEIVLKEPFAPLMTTTLPLTSGYVLSRRAVEERGKKYPTQPIGTGPYELAEWKPKQRLVLQRFADYGGANSEYAPPVEWREIVGTPIGDDHAADIALETGEIDFGAISLPGIDRFKANADFTVHDRTTLDYGWIGMNVQHPKLQDVNVREAVRYAIDVPSILEAAFENRHTQATAIIPPGMPLGHWEEAPVYERDVEKAKGFLQQAGVSDLELTMTVPKEATGAKTIGEIVQANLADVGIDVKLNIVESAVLNELGDVLKPLQLFYVYFVTTPDPSWSTVWFTCDQILQWNWMFWCDQEYDRLHLAALEEQDPARRDEMYIEMQKLWDEGTHTVWLHWPTVFYAARRGIEPALRPDGRILPWAFRSA
jgi:peptide/nickel transport system substrate-binding protein